MAPISHGERLARIPVAQGAPLETLERMTDMRLAPLTPILKALDGSWTGLVRPERMLRVLVLMLFFDLGDEALLCREIRARPSFRLFLHMKEGEPDVDPSELRYGVLRLLNNHNAREFLRDIAAAARASGLAGDARFSPSDEVLRRWTIDLPGAVPTEDERG